MGYRAAQCDIGCLVFRERRQRTPQPSQPLGARRSAGGLGVAQLEALIAEHIPHDATGGGAALWAAFA